MGWEWDSLQNRESQCFMSQVAQVAKEGLREQVVMDELNLNTGVQFSCVAGERKDVPVVGVVCTKRWKLEKVVFVGIGMLWMVEVSGCKTERWEMTLERGQGQMTKYLVYCLA